MDVHDPRADALQLLQTSLSGLSSDLGIEVREQTLTRYDIFTADECFLTGTAAEVIPVVSLDQRRIGREGDRHDGDGVDVSHRYPFGSSPGRG